MKLSKFLALLPILLLVLSIVSTDASAAVVTKTDGNLEVTYDDPLFSADTLWHPGFSQTKPVTVKNQGNDKQDLTLKALNASQTGNLATVLWFSVLESGGGKYGANHSKTLKNFWDEGEVKLADLVGNGQTNLDITIEMDPGAGNEYQNKEAKFDLSIGWVGAAVVITTTPAPGTGAAAVCDKPAPPAPTLTSISRTSVGSATLAWTAVSPVTHYLVAYGTTSGIYSFGNPNVGNTTSYGVGSLDNLTYYFVVAGVNDCAQGPYSNELAAPPPGLAFPPPVLGLATAAPLPAGTISPEGVATRGALPEVAGAAVSECNPWWWFLLLITQAVLSFVFMKRQQWSFDRRRFLIACSGILSAGLYYMILNRKPNLCPFKWFYLCDVGLVTLFVLWLQRQSRQPDETSV